MPSSPFEEESMTICNVLPNVSSVTVTDDSVMNVNSGGTATSVTV